MSAKKATRKSATSTPASRKKSKGFTAEERAAMKAGAQELKAELSPRTWYGMPAYAMDDRVVCFFQSSHKFKSRYATFGFNDTANLDQGGMWPTSFALKKLTAAEEAKIAALVKKAVR